MTDYCHICFTPDEECEDLRWCDACQQVICEYCTIYDYDETNSIRFRCPKCVPVFEWPT